jgi:molybdate transport system substrate-binding protein
VARVVAVVVAVARVVAVAVAVAVALVVGLVVLASGCAPAAPRDTLVVFAASSLRAPFSALAGPFRAAHPGVDVVFSFAGTPELRAQLHHGAAADVFAAADHDAVQALVDEGRLQPPQVFAGNGLVVVAPPGGITRFDELPAAPRVALGAAHVPAGRYAEQALAAAAVRRGDDFRARVLAHVASREPNVKQVLARVRTGEADAGFVYRSDVVGVDDVVVVPLPDDVVVSVAHPVAVVVDTPRPALARAWVDLLLSPPGQRALRAAGFVPVRPEG